MKTRAKEKLTARLQDLASKAERAVELIDGWEEETGELRKVMAHIMQAHSSALAALGALGLVSPSDLEDGR